MRLTNYFPTILAGLFFAWLLSPAAIWMTRRYGLVDVPGISKHKIHDKPTPMAGGLIIMLSLLIPAYWHRWFNYKSIIGMIIGAVVIFFFGTLDDYKGFDASKKLLGQILATFILILTGTQVHLFNNNLVNLTLTVFWVVGIVNAYNFVDSMDGLALGLAGIASTFFLLVTIESAQTEFASFSAVILGSTIGLYFFNISPAKLFLGDSGAQQLGFLMAAIGVGYNPVGLQRINSWFVPIILLGVPIFDTALVVFSRLRRGKKVYQASNDHTYHRLCRLGFAPTRAVFTMHLMGIVLGFIAFIALNTKAILGNVIFVSIVIAGCILIIFFEKRDTG